MAIPPPDRLIEDLNVEAQELLATPEEIKAALPIPPRARQTLLEARSAVRGILERSDHRLLVVVGPCSIHDPEAALDYAHRLRALAADTAGSLLLLMRVYYAKPRTRLGWKGLVNDPRMDDSFDIEKGLYISRKLLIDINNLGMPCATEALDPVCPQYLHDLIAWSAIGARTTESQTHREMASGLSSPVGFKNGTDGSLEVAINALLAAASPHSFLGVDPRGRVAVTRTRGNPHAHIVLRGGSGEPNYSAADIRRCEGALAAAGLTANILVDCSHANSRRDPTRQVQVVEELAEQIGNGNRSIIGLMLESNILGGNQAITGDPAALTYGQSVTDACLDWPATAHCLRKLAQRLADLPGNRQGTCPNHREAVSQPGKP